MPRDLFVILAVILTAQSGCRSCAPDIRAALERPAQTAHVRHAVQEYTVSCPDVLEVGIGPRPDLSGIYSVEADGCIHFKDLGKLRVVGATCEEITDRVVKLTGAVRADVDVSVAGAASRQVLVFGPEQGASKAVSYRGPETVTDFLRRMGGLDPGAEPFDITVIRPNVASGRKPELFAVDLRAILLSGNPDSDVVLEPNDQLYLGETKSAAFKRMLPSWLTPAGWTRPAPTPKK